jgi:hypothetical protein
MWSDGIMTGDTPYYEDPVVRCLACGQLFAGQQAVVPNPWGYTLPKDRKFYRPKPITLADCQEILNNEPFLTQVGASIFIERENTEQKRQQALDNGTMQIRMLIWRKLNDIVRQEETGLSPEQQTWFAENARALLPLLPDPNDDQNSLLWRAELLRNLGEFASSRRALRQVTEKQLRKTKRKMLLLTWLGNRKLVKLWGSERRFSIKLKRWRSWVW